jgi:hypothetical protein
MPALNSAWWQRVFCHLRGWFALRGRRQRMFCNRARCGLPCAGGGAGRPRPLQPRRGACAPSTPDSMRMRSEGQARMPRGDVEQRLVIKVSVERRHAPVRRS